MLRGAGAGARVAGSSSPTPIPPSANNECAQWRSRSDALICRSAIVGEGGETACRMRLFCVSSFLLLYVRLAMPSALPSSNVRLFPHTHTRTHVPRRHKPRQRARSARARTAGASRGTTRPDANAQTRSQFAFSAGLLHGLRCGAACAWPAPGNAERGENRCARGPRHSHDDSPGNGKQKSPP